MPFIQTVSTTTTDWQSVGYKMYWDNFDSGQEWTILINNNSNPHFRLKIDATSTTKGTLKLYDANNVLIGTGTLDSLVTDQWHLIELKFKRGSSADITIWHNKNKVIELTGKDLQNGSNTTSFMHFTNTSRAVVAVNQWIASYYYLSDDGANINTNKTLIGDYTIERTGTCGNGGVVPDFPASGGNLQFGVWNNNISPVPVNDSNHVRYSLAFGVSGGVSTDATPSGNKGSLTITNKVHGAKWTFRYKGQAATKVNPTPQKIFLKYGSHATASTDGTTSSASQTGSNSIKNIFFIGDVPIDEYAQMGFGADGSGSGTGSQRVYGAWCQVLHEKKGRIFIDGQGRRRGN